MESQIELNTYFCKKCGIKFETSRKSRLKLCPACVKRRNKAKRQNNKTPKAKKAPAVRLIKTDKTLSEIMEELERYNKEHKTSLSYAQYVLLMDY